MNAFLKTCVVAIAVLLSGCASRVWIADWQEAYPMNISRNGTASVLVKDKIYMIGGRNTAGSFVSTEYTTIQPDGSTAPWQFSYPLNEERSFMDAAVHGDYIYVVGGANGPSDQNLLRTVERARIMPDGTLGPWQVEKNEMVMPRRCNKVMATAKALYALGGYGGILLDSVESAEWQADGSLGEWHLEPEILTTPRYIHSVKKIGDVLYVIGGHRDNGNSMSEVEWSRLTADGTLQKWQATTSMQQERWGLATAAYRDNMYALGGLYGPKYLETVERTKVHKNGQLDPWQPTTPLDQPRATFSVITYRDWIYVLGGAYPDGYLSSVIYANTNASGEIGYWGTAEQAAEAQQHRAQRHELAAKTRLPFEGVVREVREVLQPQAYTYAQIESNVDGLVWVAGPKVTNLKTGDHIGYNQGTPLRDFSSRELQRTFPMIILVGKIQIQ